MPMRNLPSLVIFGLLLTSFFWGGDALAARQCGECPPYYCTDPELAAQLKAQKKASAEAKGLPARLSAFFDQLADCAGCIETAPDWPHIIWEPNAENHEAEYGRAPGYTRRSLPWNADLELKLREDLRKGLVNEFRIYLGGENCNCCPPNATDDQYNTWRDAEDRSLESRSSYNRDKGFEDGVPQINFEDPSQLGEEPKDLTEIPEAFRRGNAAADPGVEYDRDMVRVVQAFCPACKAQADAYNALGEKINQLNRPIAQLRRNISIVRQAIDDVWTEMHGIGMAATTEATRNTHDDLMQELSDRQNDLEKIQRELREKLTERGELEAQLADAMAALKECEDKCKQAGDEEAANAAIHSAGVAADAVSGEAQAMAAGAVAAVNTINRKTDKELGYGDESRVQTATPEVISGSDQAVVPEGDDTTRWITGKYTTTRYSGNPSDPGWWKNEKGNLESTHWIAVKTQCEACEGLVKLFNKAMNRLYYLRYQIEQERQQKDRRIRELRNIVDNYKKKEKVDGVDIGDEGLTAGGMQLADQMENLEAGFQAKAEFLRSEISRMEADAQELARQIAECEKQCQGEAETTGIMTGSFGGWVPETMPEGADSFALPFAWDGPYTTGCYPCEKLAEALNGLPSKAYYYMGELRLSQYRLRYLETTALAETAGEGGFWDFSEETDPYTPETLAADIDRVKREIADTEAKLQKIADYFNEVLAMLRDCEKKYCSGGTDDEEVELKYTVPVSGTNPFDAKEIERIPGMVNGSGEQPVPQTPVTVPQTPVTPTTPVTPSTPSAPVTPAPLSVTPSGSFSFAHTVGGSPCPQPAGTVTLISSSGNPLTISGLSVSGSIAGVMNASASGNQVTAQFTCASPATANYTGAVTGIATDTVTGQTANFSIPATGSVSN